MEISGRLIARNSVLNLAGHLIPLLAGIVAIPILVRGLGLEQFGILSLAWVVLGYATIFDLGLGRATTKHVAEALGRGGAEEIPSLVGTALAVQLAFGAAATIVLAALTPFLVGNAFAISIDLADEARATMYLIALAIPIVLVSGSFSGVLEARQRFDLVNSVRIPTSTLTFLLPAAGVASGFQILEIVALILLMRVAALVALVALVVRTFSGLSVLTFSRRLVRRLISYGGWITVTSVVAPAFVYLDRFLIASLVSVSAVSYYAAPYETVTRLWILPASLVISLFPAFSILEGARNREAITSIFLRSTKYLLLSLGPLAILLILFAHDLLRLWLGEDFATQSGAVLQILAFGVLINSVAQIPYALLQGVGRPDLTGKFHLVEFPIYVSTVWILILEWGIKGAAVAWLVRVALDAFLLFTAALRIHHLPVTVFARHRIVGACLALAGLAAGSYGLGRLINDHSLLVRGTAYGVFLVLFALGAWKKVLDASERSAIAGFLANRKSAKDQA